MRGETMLERMARAAYDAEQFKERDDMGSDVTWMGLAEFQRQDRIGRAKAALLAIREPTNELLYRLAGYELVNEGEPEEWLYAWQEACDFILNESPSPSVTHQTGGKA